MSQAALQSEHDILLHDLREAYMEVFPTGDIAQKLEVLEPNAYVAVTCSPTKGVEETLDLAEQLLERGFRVTPHVAARNVRDRRHLAAIMARLAALDIESMFVPGGDRPEPLGDYRTALELLRDVAELDHAVREIGIAAHPEGHPDVEDDILFKALEEKQQYAQYIVTQMCFDADRLGRWLIDICRRGIRLPVWIGLPGAIERRHLLRTSMRIGVGDSLRYLRKKPGVASALVRSSTYHPDDLVRGIARYQAMPETNVAGYHLFCFNQVARTERWRHDMIRRLS